MTVLDAPSDPYAGSVARQYWLIIALTLIATLGAMDRQILSLLGEGIRKEMHLSDTQFSLVYGAAFALANVLFMIPAGFLADRGRRKQLLGIGVAVWSLMGVFCGLASNFAQLFFARAGVGFGESVIQPLAVSMLRSGLAPERRGSGFAIYAMAIMLGTAFALLLGGLLVKFILANGIDVIPFIGPAQPWRIVLVLLGLAGVPALLLLLTVREPALRASGPSGKTSGYGATLAFLGQHWRLFAPLLLFNPVVGMITLSYGAWLAPILIRVWHLTPPQVGETLGPMMLILPLPGLLLTGRILDRLVQSHGARGPTLFAIPVVIAFGIINLACPLMNSPALFWALLACVIAISGVCFPITNLLITLTVPPHLVGKVSAIQYIIYGIVGATLGPTVVALVSDNFFSGAIATALGAVSGVCALAALLCMIFTERHLRRGDGALSETNQ